MVRFDPRRLIPPAPDVTCAVIEPHFLFQVMLLFLLVRLFHDVHFAVINHLLQDFVKAFIAAVT